MTNKTQLNDDEISVEIRKAKFEHDMALKTLKDIELQINHEFVCPSEDLKAEAIKWVKYIEEIKDKAIFQNQLLGNTLTEEYFKKGQEFINQINWIKHFFNLTDEDLK